MARKSRNSSRNSRPKTSVAVAAADGSRSNSVGETVASVPAVEPENTVSTTDPSAASIDHRLLLQMADQIRELHHLMAGQVAHPNVTQVTDDACADVPDSETDAQLLFRIDELASQLRFVEIENEELRQQNGDLAAQLASASVRSTVSTAQSSTSDALSWDERKALILLQMEQETFDGEAFVNEMQSESSDSCESPLEFVAALKSQLDKQETELAERNEEIGELRILLQNQSETRESGLAFGAAAIAEFIDSDELILQERKRLQLMQAEWEEKFRKSEIEASLERAKLSRERQQLQLKTAELQEQMEHVRREARQTEENGAPSSRRWMVKLGLAGEQ